MANASILEIPVDDEAFKRFQAEFEKHKAAVQELPGDWSKVNVILGGVEAGFAALVETSLRAANAAEITAKNTRDVVDAIEAADRGGIKFLSTVHATSYGMGGLARNTKDVAFWVKDATVSLLKWTGIVGALGGLLGAGGIWGIDRLAASAGNARRSALGLGVTSGEQEAFGVNFGRFVDPNSTLENVADAQSDLTKRWAFSALGIANPQDRDAADLAPELIKRAKALFDKNPTQQAAEAYGLTQFFSMDDLRRLHNTPQAEIDAQQTRYERDRRALAVDPNIQRRWQDFSSQLSRAGQQIENTFIIGLEPLAGPLGDLSKGFTDVVAAFLKAPQIREWIGDAAGGLESFAKFIGTPAFKADVESFVTGLERLGKALGSAFAWLQAHLPGLAPGSGDTTGPGGQAIYSYPRPDKAADAAIRHADSAQIQAWKSAHPVLIPASQTDWYIRQAAGLNGVPIDFARKVFKAEGGLNADGSARISSAGAIGAGQLMPGTAQQLGVNPFDTADNILGSVRYMQMLLAKYGGDQAKAAAAYNWGGKHVDDDIAAHGANWRAFAPPETRAYVASIEGTASSRDPAAAPKFRPVAPQRVAIDIHNNTGGSAVVSSSQAAAQ